MINFYDRKSSLTHKLYHFLKTSQVCINHTTYSDVNGRIFVSQTHMAHLKVKDHKNK